MADHCKEDVPDGGRSVGFHKCSRKAVCDGYCKVHHPDNVAARRKATSVRYEEQQANSPLARLVKAKAQLKKADAYIAELERKNKTLREGMCRFCKCSMLHKKGCQCQNDE